MNLSGIVDDNLRVPPAAINSLAVYQGEFVAWRQGQQVLYKEGLPADIQRQIGYSLVLTARARSQKAALRRRL
jgi:hypothetical protein